MSRRTYGQYCPLARSLDVVGERWTLLVVRELLVGPRRFTDLLEGLPGIGTSMLSSRLTRLQDEGIVARSYLEPPAASRVYELTKDGRDLGQALVPLVHWGLRRLGTPQPGEVVKTEGLLLTFQGAFRSELAAGVRVLAAFDLEVASFFAEVADGSMRTGAGRGPRAPDVVVLSDLQTFVDIGAGRLRPEDALASGRMTTEGDPGALALLFSTMLVTPPSADD